MILRVSDFRKGDHFDDGAIAACLLERKKYESAEIVFDGPDYWISQAICLPSNTTVIIDGCAIRQIPETFDNVFRGDNLEIDPENPWGLPLSIAPLENIRILGKNGASIIGPERNRIDWHKNYHVYEKMVGDDWGWRALTISLSRCKGFEIGNLYVEKTRNWAIAFDLCCDGCIHDIEFNSNVKTGDGIDFRSGCHHCLVENITGITSDDTIACTALFRNVVPTYDGRYQYPCEPTRGILDRTKEEKDVSHITIRNVKTGGRHHGIICLAANGCQVHHIHIENVTEDPTYAKEPWREATVKLYTGYGKDYTPGDIHDITVENVKGVYADNALFCNTQVENVLLKKITHKKNDPFRLDYPEGIEIQE